MTKELMSLEHIKMLAAYGADEWTNAAVKELLATARAAHELKAEVERLERRDRNFAEQIKLNVTEEIAKARQEERERCAKAASEAGWIHLGSDLHSMRMDRAAREQVEACIKAIHDLKDCNDC